jgi:glycosyltransferase involved in cell wall biosynthesis
MRGFGHSITIVASDAWGTLPDDQEIGVVRVGDLRASKSLRRLLRRGKLRVEGDSELVEPPPTALLTKVLVPEMHVVTWLPALVVAVRRLLRHRSFDCLVTTSPPESAHLLGLLLGAHRPAWIADFRDGWNFEPWREPFPTRAQRVLDASLERRVVEAADVVVGATRPISEDLERRLGAYAAWVPNGWDPALAPAPSSATKAADFAQPKVMTLVYTGTLSGAWGRDPEPFFRALRLTQADTEAKPLRLIHAGPLTTEERKLIARTGVTDLVEHLGTLNRADALALQRSADALLLLTSRNTSEATSKVFEYLAARRPIVALAENNEAARIIRDTNTGVTVPPDDVVAITAALRSVASGELVRSFAPRGVERFTYPGLAEAMAELVEEAVRRRSLVIDSDPKSP